jgi:hypothetical protein
MVASMPPLVASRDCRRNMAREIVLNFCVYMPTPFPGFSYGPCALFGGVQCLYLFVDNWKSGCRQSPCVRACLMYNAAHRTTFCKAVCALHGRHSFRVTVCPHQTNSTHGCYAVLRGVCNCVLAAGCAAWLFPSSCCWRMAVFVCRSSCLCKVRQQPVFLLCSCDGTLLGLICISLSICFIRACNEPVRAPLCCRSWPCGCGHCG